MKEKLSQMSNLQQRVIAAVVAVPFLIFCIYYSDYSYFGLFAIISVLTQLEFYKLVGLAGNEPLTYYGTFCGFVLNVLTFLIEKHTLGESYYYVISPLMASVFFIKLYKAEDDKPFKNIAYTFLGIIYVALPFALITVLAFLDNYQYSWQKILGCLFLLWASDTGAYFREQTSEKPSYLSEFLPKNLGKEASGDLSLQ